jgi:glycosyltransferase involved in cell wall biosynthesis
VIPTGALAAKLAKVKHIWYLHEFGKEDHGLEFWYGQKRSFKIVNSLSDFCIANSQAVYDYFNRYIQANKLAKIFYACEMPATAKPERANFTESQQLNLIVTGRIAPGKGQLDAVKAVGLLRKNGIDARLSFQGTADENYLAEIKTYIEANGLVDHIHFLPYSSTPQDAVRKADVVLVCSRLEAFGRVTVEAMKLGVPIVATSTAGSLELIGEGNQRGLMYQPGDVDALVNHLISYHSNPELRYQKALLAHQYAWANCNLDFHTKQIEEIFNKI